MRNKRAVALTACGLMLVGLPIWSGEARANKAVLGWLTSARGQVQVDKDSGLPGTALIEGDVIATGSKSNAIIDLRSGIKVTAAETTEVAFPYETSSARLELRRGAVEVQAGPGKVSQINASFATSVILGSENGFPALCRISAVGSEVGVLNEKGRVEIHGAGAPFLLPPGKYVVLQAGKPQAGSQTVGQVIAAIPTEVVERQGAAAVPLHISDPVYGQDLVTTENEGRVRIQLTGGTVLNIGVRSQMRIVKHDEASQQTEIELKAGKLREQVVKLMQPGASFQTKTQTAVIGVVGTDVIIIATADSTQIICVDGTVTVSNVNPSIPGSVTLQAGQSTTVPANGPPSAAVQVSPKTLQSQMSQTGIQTIQHVAVPWAGTLDIAYAGIAGAGVAVTSVAVSKLGNASDLSNKAASNASDAASGLNGLGSGITSVGCGLNGLAGSEGQASVYTPSSGTCQ